jgi:hypothetical protein
MSAIAEHDHIPDGQHQSVRRGCYDEIGVLRPEHCCNSVSPRGLRGLVEGKGAVMIASLPGLVQNYLNDGPADSERVC